MHGSTERMSAQKLNDIWTGRVIQIPTTIANPSHTEERKNEHVNLGLFAVRNLAVLHCEKTQIHSAIIMTNGNLMRDKSWVNDWCMMLSLRCIFLWGIPLFLISPSFWTPIPVFLLLQENEEAWFIAFSFFPCSCWSMTQIWARTRTPILLLTFG